MTGAERSSYLNVKRAAELAQEASVEALVASTPENVTYLSGYRSYTQLHLRNQVYAVSGEGFGRAAVVAPLIDTGELALAERRPSEVLFYGRFFISSQKAKRSRADEAALGYIEREWPLAEPTALEALVRAIKEKGLSSSRIGVDEDGMTPEGFGRLKSLLPRARLVSASSLFKRIRMVKTREEIALLRSSTQAAERAIEVGLSRVTDGTTEKSLAREIEHELARWAEPGIVNAYGGPDSAYILRAHLDRRIRKGDQIWLDVGCYYEGYCSDTGTTAVRGRPGDKLKRYHEAVVRGQRKAMEAVRPGARASELHKIAVSEVKRTIQGFDRTQVGHGLGLEHYEPPSLGPDDQTALEEGMVINVETPYYEIGFGGLMAEDTLVVTKEGYELLTKMGKDLRIVK